MTDGSSFEEYMQWQRGVRDADRPRSYIAGSSYEDVIYSIIVNIILRPEVSFIPDRIEVEAIGPLEFALRTMGNGLRGEAVRGTRMDEGTGNLVWEMKASARNGDINNSLSTLSCLLGWSEHLHILYAAAETVYEQTYANGFPTAPAQRRPRLPADPAFLLHARMEPGHFPNETLQRSRLLVLSESGYPVQITIAPEIA